jgi:hypothetical protein
MKAVLVCLMAAGACCAATIGEPVINRDFTDTSPGSILMYAGAFGVSEQVVSWSFFSDTAGVGSSITPLLFSSAGVVTAIGATRVAALGVNSFAFGLVSGTDLVGVTDTFGWKDGPSLGSGGGNPGVAEFNFGGTGPSVFWNDGAVGYNVGSGISFVALAGRDYSIQFTTAPISQIPEPTTWGLIGAGLGLLGLSRRRLRSQ